MTRDQAQTAAWKTIELATKLAIPILVVATAGLWTQVSDNRDNTSRLDERVKSIEKTMFTPEDATELLHQIRSIMREEFSTRLAPIEEKIGEVKIRLDRVEQR